MKTIQIPASSFLLGLALLLAVPFAFFEGHASGTRDAMPRMERIWLTAAAKLVAQTKPTSEQAAFDALGLPQNAEARAHFRWTPSEGFAVRPGSTFSEFRGVMVGCVKYLGISLFYWAAIIVTPVLFRGVNPSGTIRTKSGAVAIEIPIIGSAKAACASGVLLGFLVFASNWAHF